MSQSSIDISLEERSNSNNSYCLVLDDARHPYANVRPPAPQQEQDAEVVVSAAATTLVPATIETNYPHDEPSSEDEDDGNESVVIMESGPSSSASSSASADAARGSTAEAGRMVIDPPSMNASDLASNVSGSWPSLPRRKSPPRPPSVVVETTNEESAMLGGATTPTMISHTRFDAHDLDDEDDPLEFPPMLPVEEEVEEKKSAGGGATYHDPELPLRIGEDNDIMAMAAVLEQMAQTFRYEPSPREEHGREQLHHAENNHDGNHDIDEVLANVVAAADQPTAGAATERARKRKTILDKPITVVMALACLALFGTFQFCAPGTRRSQSKKLLMRPAPHDNNKPPHVTPPPLNHSQQSVNILDQVDSSRDRGAIQTSGHNVRMAVVGNSANVDKSNTSIKMVAAVAAAVPEELEEKAAEDCQFGATSKKDAIVETPVASKAVNAQHPVQGSRQEPAAPEPTESESSKVDINGVEEPAKGNLQKTVAQDPSAQLSKKPSSQSKKQKSRDEPLSTGPSLVARSWTCGEWIILVLLGACLAVQVSRMAGATTPKSSKRPHDQAKDHHHHANARQRRVAPPASRDVCTFIDECRHRLQRTGHCCRRNNSSGSDDEAAIARNKAHCYDCFTKDDLYHICQFLNVANLSNVSRRGKNVMIDELIHCYEDLLWGYTVVEIKSILQAHHHHNVRPKSGLNKSALVDLAVTAAF